MNVQLGVPFIAAKFDLLKIKIEYDREQK